MYIRRPRPSPRQGRRLGPPEVWNLLCHGHGLHLPNLKSLKRSPAASTRHSRPEPSATSGIRGCRLPVLKGLKRSAAASKRHAGHRPSATIGVRSCRLPALKGLKPSAAASTGSFDQALRPQPSATIDVRGCRLPALKGL